MDRGPGRGPACWRGLHGVPAAVTCGWGHPGSRPHAFCAAVCCVGGPFSPLGSLTGCPIETWTAWSRAVNTHAPAPRLSDQLFHWHVANLEFANAAKAGALSLRHWAQVRGSGGTVGCSGGTVGVERQGWGPNLTLPHVAKAFVLPYCTAPVALRKFRLLPGSSAPCWHCLAAPVHAGVFFGNRILVEEQVASAPVRARNIWARGSRSALCWRCLKYQAATMCAVEISMRCMAAPREMQQGKCAVLAFCSCFTCCHSNVLFALCVQSKPQDDAYELLGDHTFLAGGLADRTA